MSIPKKKFIDDFTFICTKNPNVKLADQVKKLNEYKPWRDLPILDKINYLEKFSENEKETLKGLWHWFKKWIEAERILVSVKIGSERATTTKTRFDDDNRAKKLVLDVKDKKQKGKKNNEQFLPKTYVKYNAEIGRVKTWDMKGKEGEHKQVKVYQLWHFDFSEQHDGRYFCRSYIKKVVPEDWPVQYPTATNPFHEELGNQGCIHETAQYLSQFINIHDANFVEKLDIDVKYWSQLFSIEKFRHIRNLRIVHNAPGSTHWWLNRINTMRTIPEVTIARNYTGDFVEEKEYRSRRNAVMHHEVMPYVIPFEEREMPNWVEKTSYCNYPIFWAKRIIFENTIENPLTDLARMSSLAEVNLNRYILPNSELLEFLQMWSNGQMGHRLRSVTINLDCPLSKSEPILNGLQYSKTSDIELSSPLTKAVEKNNYISYVLYREWKVLRPDGLQSTRGFQKESLSSGYGSSLPGSGPSTPPSESNIEEAGVTPTNAESKNMSSGQHSKQNSSDETQSRDRSGSGVSGTSSNGEVSSTPGRTVWHGGACALLQISQDKKNILFTAIHNEKFACELARFRFSTSK